MKIIPFIKKTWGLSNQPVKKEYFAVVKDLIKNKKFNKIKAKHFGPFIKGKHFTWQQYVILLCIDNGIDKITVSKGHGIGADTLISWINIWILMEQLSWHSITMCPTYAMTFDICFKELVKWRKLMSEGGNRIRKRKNTFHYFSLISYKASNIETIGESEYNDVAIILNEASGIKDKSLYDLNYLSFAPNVVFTLIISNPIGDKNLFYNTHEKGSEYYKLIFSSKDSPLVNKDYIKTIRKTFGSNSDEYRERVTGRLKTSK